MSTPRSRSHVWRALGLTAVLCLTRGAPQPIAAQTVQWRVASGEVVVHCPLTVGGSFQATTTAITGQLAADSSQPSRLAGELAVDLKTLDSGIRLRNTHMRENYLEIGKGDGFDRAVLSEIALASGDAATITGSTSFTGVLLVHGTKKPVSGQARVTRSGADVRVEASFPVNLADFGIAEPRYLGVGVKDQVQVRVRFGSAP
jgi:polyisoprenoid-binding protein YceI